ncbi:ASCH domain-containing protein [Acinetobacter shaoyimingii]|uniref:ASCH domain-containing protein n=1 Tax=Acinetobacter shaoyimingii TaxID=2715164 RepID=A0A6G8RSS9_9GAMM|nr:ASCH domain-containing protein [Acinetobacter shaoyimingii]QIO04945.1 ASCH domain-containing protein [Acinetobacter shaoyimingii]
MKNIYAAISIVAPSGQKIILGEKTLEIRSWKPDQLPLKNLAIIENHHYLTEDSAEEQGQFIALVDVESVHVWQPNEVEQACAQYWQAGYFAWVLKNIRPLKVPIKTIAKRKIYQIEVDPTQFIL